VKFCNIISIDPGNSGAVVIRQRAGYVSSVSNFSGRSTILDVVETVRRAPLYDYGGWAAVIERVWASPAMGVSSAFAFGGNYESWITGLCCAGVPVFGVTPQKWQRAVCPDITSIEEQRKRDLRDRAAELFPAGAFLEKTRVTLKNCDALLLSEYAHRQNLAENFELLERL
jgi:hypothetical protein